MRGEKKELWTKSAVAEEINEWIYNKFFFANAKLLTMIYGGKLSNVYTGAYS